MIFPALWLKIGFFVDVIFALADAGEAGSRITAYSSLFSKFICNNNRITFPPQNYVGHILLYLH
jgi:hypothetical protein